jgi:outer membrane protein insertion porin family
MHKIINTLYCSFCLAILFGVGSCKSTKYLDEDQSLIKEVKITIEDSKDIPNKEALSEDLSYFLRQQKNKKAFWIPREYIYLKANEPNDTSKFDNWLRNKVGEEPSIYSEEKSKLSSKTMEQYLRFKKGFPEAVVTYKTVIQNQIAKIEYFVKTGKRFYINGLEYFSKDQFINEELNKIAPQSELKKGDPIDADIFEKEKIRIVSHFQNNGYAEFASNYIIINGDSTIKKYLTDIIIEVVPPSGKTNHIRYKIGQIKVATDYYNKQDTTDMISQNINGISFLSEQSTFIVKPSILAQNIAFTNGKLLSRTDKITTYNKLSALTSYRFVEILSKVNKIDSSLIDLDINLSPHVKKWSRDIGLDVFNSSITRSSSTVKRLNLLGIGVSSQLENKNLFGGSERYTLNAEFGAQLELSNADNIFRSFNYSLNNTINYPVFRDPLYIVRGFHRFYLPSKKIYNNFLENATTNVNLGVFAENFKSQYNILSFNTAFGYKYNDKISKNLNVDVLGLTLNRYQLDAKFVNNLKDSTFLIKSFEDNLFSGFIFRSLNFTSNSPKNNLGLSSAYLFNFELSGLEITALNGLSNLLNNNDKIWSLGSLDFSKYVRLEFDGRITKHFSKDRNLVGRFNIGLINPWGKDKAAPFVRQFEVGGPNSLRAWAPRVLGPGANQNVVNDKNPFSRGDLKIEANLEYRFPVWLILEGAFFLDAGNIWATKGYQNTPDARFSKNFYNQIAVAGGWGMRFDFNYFNIRFDFGYRLRDPYQTNERNWYNFKSIRQQKLGNIQVAVNYPF